MRVHELHDLDSLSRTQLHRGEALALDEDERSRPELCLSVSLRQGNHTITPSLQLRCASVSEPSRTDGIAACCVHSTTSKQRGFWLRLLPHSNFFFRRSTDSREEIPREKKQKHKEVLYEILPTKLDSVPSRSTKFQIQTGATTTTTAELKSTLGCSRNKQFSKIHLQIHQVLSLGPLLSSAWTRARKTNLENTSSAAATPSGASQAHLWKKTQIGFVTQSFFSRQTGRALSKLAGLLASLLVLGSVGH